MPREYRTSVANRERNRLHARKTRQRKKEHMQNLQCRADSLKEQQILLRQAINEKNTASILVGLFQKEAAASSDSAMDPRVEELLRREVSDIPDASKVPELPALIIPASSSSKNQAEESTTPTQPDDGIDYELLNRDRSTCTPEELDKIRRERNRMHAKRTRDRKRLFMEEMEEIIKRLEEENGILQHHLIVLGGNEIPVPAPSPSAVVSPSLKPKKKSRTIKRGNDDRSSSSSTEDQIKSLLLAAGAFEQRERNVTAGTTTVSSLASAVSTSTSVSGSSSVCESEEATAVFAAKKVRLDDNGSTAARPEEVPASITTSLPSNEGVSVSSA